jgi:hypothetical protein
MRFSSRCLLLLLVTTPHTSLAFAPPGRTSFAVVRPGAVRNSNSLQQQHNYALPPQTPEIAKEGVIDLISFFDSINGKLTDTFQTTLSQVLESVTQMSNEITHLADKAIQIDPAVLENLQQVTDKINLALTDLISQYPALQPVYDTINSQLSSNSGLGTAPAPVTLLISSVLTYTVVSFILGSPEAPESPYPNQRYDPSAARSYFDQQLQMVVRRGLTIAISSLGFGLSLLKDYVK